MMVRGRSPSATIAIAIAVIAAAAVLHVWVHLQVIAVGYDLSRETRAHHELAEMNQKLTLELRTRMDLQVIERAARQQLGMAPPDPRSIRLVGMP